MVNRYEGMSDEEILESFEGVFFDTWKDPDTGFESGHFLGVARYANSEICNGGFHQFYLNGIFDAARLADDLDRLPNPKWGECIRKSLARFPDGKQPIREERDLDEMEEILNKAGIGDDTFREIEDIWYANYGELDSALVQYVRDNPTEFEELESSDH